MGDGPMWLFGSIGWGIVLVVLAYRTHWVDRLAHRLDPPQRHEQRARQCSHLRVVRNGPPRWQRGPCDMDGWDDPRDAA